jgi:hypothetical protein
MLMFYSLNQLASASQSAMQQRAMHLPNCIQGQSKSPKPLWSLGAWKIEKHSFGVAH